MKINELQNEKVGLCVSGGLDSRTITKKLVDLGLMSCASRQTSANRTNPISAP